MPVYFPKKCRSKVNRILQGFLILAPIFFRELFRYEHMRLDAAVRVGDGSSICLCFCVYMGRSRALGGLRLRGRLRSDRLSWPCDEATHLCDAVEAHRTAGFQPGRPRQVQRANLFELAVPIPFGAVWTPAWRAGRAARAATPRPRFRTAQRHRTRRSHQFWGSDSAGRVRSRGMANRRHACPEVTPSGRDLDQGTL
jgi:hypothetical protein